MIDRGYKTEEVRARAFHHFRRKLRQLILFKGVDTEGISARGNRELDVKGDIRTREYERNVRRPNLNEWAYGFLTDSTPTNGMLTINAPGVLSTLPRELTSEVFRSVPNRSGTERERWIKRFRENEAWDTFGMALYGRYALGFEYSRPTLTLADWMNR